MTPRSYDASRRQEASGERREEVLEAARKVLASEGDEAFSIEEIAKRAGVSRMTVYNLFGSKARLLEELFDSLSQRAEFTTMGPLLAQSDSEQALDDVIALFGRFWTKSRVAHRRLNAAAVDDDELATAMASRNERRRNLLLALTKRILEQRAIDTTPRTTGDVVRALFMLSSFDSFDTLAGPDRTPVQVTPLVQRLARAVFDSIP
ncbi:MAG TPA: TetR/AcrR family transcriptional regulator [Gemmatimonadaceae bacterium]